MTFKATYNQKHTLIFDATCWSDAVSFANRMVPTMGTTLNKLEVIE